MTEISTQFDFNRVEAKWGSYWEGHNTFHAQTRPDKKPYSVVIPPPNVTGILHMGHALNNTLQDILVRYKRMRGFETCWMPGTDHAGIATQNVVERQLGQEGKTRYDIGRDEMLKRLWSWKHQYGDTIIKQLKKIGSSCDWSRTRFTMDEGYSEAVKDVFVRLYEKGLIYRGKYIINWCPRCQTALSDEEAEHREQQGALYHIRYPFQDNPDRYVVVATTRPETMLGDTAVAVNPEDPRFKALIGQTLVLPVIGRAVRIVADSFVDPAFGTGAVKVTPAHDPNDFAIGTRHGLDFINIFHPDASLNEEAGELAGLDRFEAREAIIEMLKNLKLLEKVEPHIHAVGHCYRCHTVIEPYLSWQWFVKMKPLAEPALKAVLDGKIRFTPDRWTKVYLNWMEGIRDWCISRQIWWGHRIPVWYCQDCPDTQNIIVSKETPQSCPRCQSRSLKQDEDVLDTWFSSWLWPFATFGWPDQGVVLNHELGEMNNDLKYFYPTSALFTASEIIFFWVARMIMAGIEFMGEIPFSDVYIHGTVRDAQGRKMSKSLGNAIDPLEIIGEFGADALRFSLIMNSGQDLYISKDKFEGGRNFANKIWNASRLVLLHVPPEARTIVSAEEISSFAPDLPGRWILSRYFDTVSTVTRAIEEFRFSDAENMIHEFFWRHFCDWYLEIVKNSFSSPSVSTVVFFILQNSIRMIHPFMPFVTEEIWAHLGLSHEILSLQDWPQPDAGAAVTKADEDMQLIIDLVTQIRNIKTQWHIKPQQEVDCILSSDAASRLGMLNANLDILKTLARIKEPQIVASAPETAGCATGVVKGITVLVPLGNVVDIDEEKQRMAGQLAEKEQAAAQLQKRLNNQAFLAKAPAEVVRKENARLNELSVQMQEIRKILESLS